MQFVVFVILFGLLAEAANGVPLPSDQKPFIIGGEDAPEAYAPYMAALIFGEQIQQILCGGSIIARNLVLTAAHCIEALIVENNELMPSFYILVGTNNWSSGGTIANIKNYIMHPQWDSKIIKNDIGVVITEKIELNKRVAIIPLDFDFVEGSERAFVTGWGVTAPKDDGYIVNLAPIPYDLQLLYMNTLDHKQCQKQMTSVAGHVVPAIQQDIEICTFHSYKYGMCKGDSGSPLVKASTRKQIGIVSWGYYCADGAPDVYVRISGFKHFLYSILKTYKY